MGLPSLRSRLRWAPRRWQRRRPPRRNKRRSNEAIPHRRRSPSRAKCRPLAGQLRRSPPSRSRGKLRPRDPSKHLQLRRGPLRRSPSFSSPSSRSLSFRSRGKFRLRASLNRSPNRSHAIFEPTNPSSPRGPRAMTNRSCARLRRRSLSRHPRSRRSLMRRLDAVRVTHLVEIPRNARRKMEVRASSLPDPSRSPCLAPCLAPSASSLTLCMAFPSC